MPSLRIAMVAILLACAAPAALAQQALEQRMSADEFRAAGLDKLSAQELATLNRWLQRQAQPQAGAASGPATEQAIEQAREEGRRQAQQEAAQADDRRAAPTGPVSSRIAGPFNGFGKGQRYTLENGQVWEQTDDARLAGVRVDRPEVTVSPGAFGAWYLRIEGYNTRAKVRRVD